VKRLRAFGAFWYDFIVGDDWRVAVAVAVALAVTYAVSRSSVASWWITPAVVALLVPLSLWRATRSGRRALPPGPGLETDRPVPPG
jgi:hypothetical protein